MIFVDIIKVVTLQSIIVSRNIKFRRCVNSTPSRALRAEAKLISGRKKVYGRTEK